MNIGAAELERASKYEAPRRRGARGPRRRWLAIQTVWELCGVTIALLATLEAGYRIQGAVRHVVASVARPRVLHPYAGEPWFPPYEAELNASFAMQWQPYVYWGRAPQRGRYINVDGAGHRHTVQPATPPGPVHHVFFFGGSTMWGTGARDEMTIPSQVAAQLAERGVRNVVITNFGETGYVFTQELLRLELELRRGARPDVVVFFDGINDVASAVINGRAGLPQNEANRVTEFHLGRVLASDDDARALETLGMAAAARLHLLRRLVAILPSSAPAGAATELAHDVVESYAHTAGLVEALSQAYGFRPFYFWQPALHTSLKPLTLYERTLWARIAADPSQRRLQVVHRAAAAAIDALMTGVAPGRLINLTRLFDGDTVTAFLDDIGHTTERANGELAAKMLGPVLRGLSLAPPGGR